MANASLSLSSSPKLASNSSGSGLNAMSVPASSSTKASTSPSVRRRVAAVAERSRGRSRAPISSTSSLARARHASSVAGVGRAAPSGCSRYRDSRTRWATAPEVSASLSGSIRCGLSSCWTNQRYGQVANSSRVEGPNRSLPAICSSTAGQAERAGLDAPGSRHLGRRREPRRDAFTHRGVAAVQARCARPRAAHPRRQRARQLVLARRGVGCEHGLGDAAPAGLGGEHLVAFGRDRRGAGGPAARAPRRRTESGPWRRPRRRRAATRARAAPWDARARARTGSGPRPLP